MTPRTERSVALATSPTRNLRSTRVPNASYFAQHEPTTAAALTAQRALSVAAASRVLGSDPADVADKIIRQRSRRANRHARTCS
jgi:hypothetical protein